LWRLSAAAIAALSACSSGSTGDSTIIVPNGGSAGQGGTSSSGGGAGQGGGGTTSNGPPSPCQLLGDEVRITEAPGASSTPSIVWTGTGYLVAWSDQRSGAGDIYTAALSPEGVKLAPETAIASTPAEDRSASLASIAGAYLAGWSEQAVPGFSVMTRQLASQGAPEGQASAAATSTGMEARPLLSTAFGAFALTWIDAPGGISAAMVARLSLTGQITRPPEPVKLGGTAATSFPASASNDTMLAAAYSDGRDGHLNLRVSLLDASLVASHDVLVRDAPLDALNPSVIWNGSTFGVAWEDLRDNDEQVYLSRVHPDGTVDAAIAVPEPNTGSANWPKLATDGSSTVVTYYQFRDGSPQIFLSVIGPDGVKKGGDLQVSRGSTGKARFASVARGSGEYAVVWDDTRFGDSEVMFARVACP
jgi:hypothetical protein